MLSKEEHVHSVFERIAPKYDLMNDLLSFKRHRYWRRFAMNKLSISAGSTVLDLCCGTCDWTITLAQASGTGHIVGLDFSPNMLEYGAEKVKGAGLSEQIELIQGNAMSLPFAENTFDHVTIGFGLRNVPDIMQVLREMQRVVKPGGKVVCLELSKPTWQPFKGIYYLYFRRLLPLLGKLVAKSYEQYKWLPESLVHFPDHHQLANHFEQVGFIRVKAYPLTGGIAALHIGVKQEL
ncbi:MAG: demethylmenaquinone methyltransferase [Gorillibacterium sp.]|nr:demethylmenaquinone methyltransferase [Gorillibacterium sp.]